MDAIMRGLSLWQPWASLWACGAKEFETRSWATSYRGPIAIHAAKKPFNTGPYLDRELYPFADALGLQDIYSFDKLPYGCILATADLIECYRMRVDTKTHRIALYDSRGNQNSVSICSKELLFGDWKPGRFAWKIANVKMLAEPMPYKGAQGLWTVHDPEQVYRMLG
jgi:hypothetical protein